MSPFPPGSLQNAMQLAPTLTSLLGQSFPELAGMGSHFYRVQCKEVGILRPDLQVKEPRGLPIENPKQTSKWQEVGQSMCPEDPWFPEATQCILVPWPPCLVPTWARDPVGKREVLHLFHLAEGVCCLPRGFLWGRGARFVPRSQFLPSIARPSPSGRITLSYKAPSPSHELSGLQSAVFVLTSQGLCFAWALRTRPERDMDPRKVEEA